MIEEAVSQFPRPISEIYKTIPYSEREDGIGILIKRHEKFKDLNIWYEERFNLIKKILNDLNLNWNRVTFQDQDCYIVIKYKSKDFLLSWLRDLFNDDNKLAFLILYDKNYEFKSSEELKMNLEMILNKVGKF